MKYINYNYYNSFFIIEFNIKYIYQKKKLGIKIFIYNILL